MQKKETLLLKKGRTFYLLMFSFMLIMLVCCVLMSAQFIVKSRQTLDNTEEIYHRLAEKCMDTLSLNVSNFEALADQLVDYTGEQLTVLSTLDRETLDETDLSQFLSNFQSTVLVWNKIPGTVPYLYFKNSNYALGTSSEADVLLSGEITNILGISTDDWNILISAGDTPVTFIQQTEQMTFARLMIAEEVAPNVVLIFAIAENTITEQMEQHYLPEDSAVIMVTANDQYLLSRQSDSFPEDFALDYGRLEGQKGYEYLRDSSTPRFLYYQNIENTEIKVAVLIDDNLYPQFYHSVILNVLLCVLLWILAGGILSYVLASKLYQPVALLLKSIPIQATPDDRSSDLAQIQSFVNMLRVSNESYAEKLENQKLVLADNLFWRLLSRAQEWTPETAVYLEEAGFPVSASRFLLFEVSVLPSPEYDTAEIGTEVYENFAFDRILVQHLEEQGYLSYAISGKDVFYVFTDMTGKNASPDFDRIHELHPPAYPLIFTISVSSVHSSLSELPDAYEEVTLVMDRLTMQNVTGQTSFYTRQLSQSAEAGNQSRFLSSLHLLSNYIQSANFAAAAEETTALFGSLSRAEEDGISLTTQLSYISETVRLSLRSVTNLDEEPFRLLQKKYPLRCTSTPGGYIAELKAFLEEMPACLLADTRDSDRIQQIAAFLREHYTDSTLSAGAVAEQFGVSISWLSIHFKTEIGTGFLDYLHACRLSYAKRLLQTTSQSIRDIALASGYTNAATFSRAFGRYEGVTPSQYRQNHGA